MPSIYVKDYDTTVEFPEGTSTDVMQKALKKKFPPTEKPEGMKNIPALTPSQELAPPDIESPEVKKMSTLTKEHQERAKGFQNFITDPNKIGRLASEALGTAAGGIIGSGAGPGGTIAGSALGFGLGNQVADIIWGERLPPEEAGRVLPQIKQGGEDVAKGLGYAIVGKGMDIAGRGLYAGENLGRNIYRQGFMPWLRGNIERLAEKQAAKKIATISPPIPGIGTQVEKNIQKSEELESAIPGLRFNLGQKTGEPNLLSLARAQSQRPGVGAGLSSESVMKQNQAMNDYITEHIRGKGNIDDFLAVVQKEQTRLGAQSKGTATLAEREATQLTGRKEQEVGSSLLAKAQKIRREKSNEATKLFNEVPEDTVINAQPLWDKVNNLFGSYDELTQRLGTTPIGMMSKVKTAMKSDQKILDKYGRPIDVELPGFELPPQLTMKQMKDFSSNVGYAQRAAIEKKEYELAYKLGQLKEGVNETYAVAAETEAGPGIEALKKATDYWKNIYVPQFRQGATAKILERTATGEQRIADSSIGAQFFKSGKSAAESADNFNLVFGKDADAKILVKDYASQSLLRAARNPTTGELESKRIASWLYEHDTALNKLGLKKEFGNIQKAMSMADTAKGWETTFNKSSLARALNVDPDRAITQALMGGIGKKQSIQRLQDMVKLAKEDKTGAAIEGLRAGIGDYFRRQTVLTARDIAGAKLDSLAKMDRFMNDFRPALQQSGLYTPAQLKAFDNVHQAVQSIAQQQRPSAGFSGSPTAELLSRMVASGASVALGRWGVYAASYGAFQRLLGKPLQEKIELALARAVFDPRYAEVISGLASNLGKLPTEEVAKIFRQQVITLGLMENERPFNISQYESRASGGLVTPPSLSSLPFSMSPDIYNTRGILNKGGEGERVLSKSKQLRKRMVS